MTWFKLDDGFHSHPKVIAAGNAAVGLFTRCGTWSSDHLTDGRIPAHIARFYGTKKEIGALVTCGLWRVDGDWYVMPDYLDYNPSGDAVKRDRSQSAERQRKARDAAKSRRDSDRTSPDEAVPPTRPDPITTQSSSQLTSVTPPPADDETGKRDRIATEYARLAWEQANQTLIKNPEPFRLSKHLKALENPELARYIHEYPTATETEIACWLHGETGSRRNHQRVLA